MDLPIIGANKIQNITGTNQQILDVALKLVVENYGCCLLALQHNDSKYITDCQKSGHTLYHLTTVLPPEHTTKGVSQDGKTDSSSTKSGAKKQVRPSGKEDKK